MCFRDIILFEACGHRSHGAITVCEAHQQECEARPWSKKLISESPLHCLDLTAVSHDDPNLCPECLDDRLRTLPAVINSRGAETHCESTSNKLSTQTNGSRDGQERGQIQHHFRYVGGSTGLIVDRTRDVGMEARRARKDQVWNDLVRQIERDAAEQEQSQHPTAQPQDHPRVAFAKALAKVEYRVRNDPRLVDPATSPVRTSWMERTYNAPVIASEWLKLSRKMVSPSTESTPPAGWQQMNSLPFVPEVDTSAVPFPLMAPKYEEKTARKTRHVVREPSSVAAVRVDQKPGNGDRGSPRYMVKKPPKPYTSRFIEHFSSDDADDEVDFSPRSSGQCSLSTQSEGKDTEVLTARLPQRLAAYDREYQVGEEVEDENGVLFCPNPGPAAPKAKKRSKKLEKRKQKILLPGKRGSIVEDDPQSSQSWETVASASSSGWLKSKIAAHGGADDMSFMCKDAARIERRGK